MCHRHVIQQVGQVFHPDQDRIISVRECARAQVPHLNPMSDCLYTVSSACPVLHSLH
jgi:site-specific DNA-cytosine methylase